MNIIEAIKSGRRFRRKAWDKDTQQLSWNEVYGTQPLEICYGDVVAEDWEVEEAEVTITRAQFDEAWDRAILKMEYRFTKDGLAKELGL